MKNKKLIIVFMVLLLLISTITLFVGYNLGLNTNKVIENENFETNKNEINNTEELQQIEITVNNWQDYIELEDVEETMKDDFGEITGTRKYTIMRFKKNVIKNDNVKLKIKYSDQVSVNKMAKEQIIDVYNGSDEFTINYKLFVRNKNDFDSKDSDYRITINDFEVINAKGTVYIK